MIITIVRTKNEEKNIEKFCRSYLESGLADAVFVADGGSDDRTVELAGAIPGVEVREFSGQVFGESGVLWRNPHGEHINFMSDWAMEAGADWIIFDDCDCLPNELLKEHGRALFEATLREFVYAVRIYFWEETMWFPSLSIDFNKGSDCWMHSLWAWRSGNGFQAKEDDPWRHEFLFDPTVEQYQKVSPPLSLLHRPWTSERAAQKKLLFYRSIGQHPTMLHPKEFGGDLEPIRKWMK